LELLGDDALAVRADPRRVDRLEGGRHSDGSRGPHVVGDLCRVQQRLGGYAPAMQAGAADLVLLDERDLLAELAGPQRSGVAAAAAAEDHDVELVRGHQDSFADARAKAMRERTAAPVGPFSVCPYGAPLCSPEPAMSRCTQGMRGASSASEVRPMKRRRKSPAKSDPPERSPMFAFTMS